MPDIVVAAPDGPLPAFLAMPPGGDARPGVVVIHDALGLTKDIIRICERLADHGFLALAPALYRRGNRLRCVVSTLRAASSGSGPAFDDLTAARTHLAADTRCTGKVGVIGFCMGGGFCLQVAPRGIFDAAAPNYGLWPKDPSELTRSCPTVASYGAKDRLLPDAAAKLEALLAEGDVPRDVKAYPDVGHSFMNRSAESGPLQFVERVAGLAYSEPEAEDAWRRILTFFDEHLVASAP